MNQNILFVTIDSLRADRCYGENKTSKLPNIEYLIDNGVYFSQNFVPAAQTITSLSSIFTGLYPIKSKSSHSNFSNNSFTFFDLFKKNNYYSCCCVPDLYFLKELSKNFDDRIVYPYVETTSHIHLGDGIASNVVDKLKKMPNSKPWIFYIHLMDLKDPSVFSTDFDDSQFGDTAYERNLSGIDASLGQIIKNIDLSKTIFVLSSDHGKYIPITGTETTDIPTIQEMMRKGKNVAPFLTPVGRRVFGGIQKIAKKSRERKLKSVYSAYEMRSFTNQIDSNLFDEILNTPLIIASKKIPSKIISNMVRSIDIFPTILELTELSDTIEQTNGRSLLPLINNLQIKEEPIYLQSPEYPKKLSENVGIRTSDFKYFRNRDDKSKNVHLYNLKNDPKETLNLAETNQKIVDDMENSLQEIHKNFENINSKEFSDKEMETIEKELQKLGYM